MGIPEHHTCGSGGWLWLAQARAINSKNREITQIKGHESGDIRSAVSWREGLAGK